MVKGSSPFLLNNKLLTPKKNPSRGVQIIDAGAYNFYSKGVHLFRELALSDGQFFRGALGEKLADVWTRYHWRHQNITKPLIFSGLTLTRKGQRFPLR